MRSDAETPAAAANGRPLSEAEREKYREWQTRELLRRRNGPASGDGTGPSMPGASAGGKPMECPKCGTPYRNPNYRRCQACSPAFGGGRRAEGARATRDTEAPVEAPGGVAPPPVVLPPIVLPPIAPSRQIAPLPQSLGLAVAAIRHVVDALAGLEDEDARWVLDAAYRLSRGGGGPKP